MPAPWTELDRRLAPALGARAGFGPDRVRALNEAGWAKGLTRGGSVVLGAAVAEGALTPAQADHLLGQLLRSSGESGVVSGVHRVPPAPGAPAPGAPSAPAPVAPPAAAFGASPAPAPGAPSAPATVAPPAPAFGASPAPAFGASPAPAFGASPAPAFGASPASPGGRVPAHHAAPTPTRADGGAIGADDGEDAARTVAADAQGTLPDGGASLAASLVLAPTDPARRYELRERHAEPSGEERCVARDRRLGREVELRLAPPGADPAAFLREARLVAQLDHPAIPKVHDLGQLGGRAFVVVDRQEGERLARLLERPRGARPPLPALLRAFLKVGGAVVHAHARGCVHGDIHTTAVVVGHLGEAWLEGWGRACLLPPRAGVAAVRGVERHPAPAPPAAHAAPEVRDGDAPGPRADVWGLGALLHACLTGAWPGRRAARGAATVGVPRELLAVARKALSPSLAGRYPSAEALVEDVRAYLDGRSVSADPTGVARSLARVARAHPVPAGIAAAGLAAVLALAGVTGVRVRQGLLAARAQREDAQAARRRAEAAKADADRSLAAVRVAEARARDRRALAATLGGPAQTAQGLDAAAAALRRLDDAAAGGDDAGGAALRRSLWIRLLFARGEFFLRRAVPPDPARALADLRDAARRVGAERAPGPVLEAVRADALLGAYLAARRLPGRAAEEAERALVTELAGLDGAHGRVGRAVPRVEALEREAERRVQRRPPALVPLDPGLLAELTELVKERGGLALGHELLGRYLFAVSGPGLHRSVPCEIDGRVRPIEGARDQYYGAYASLALASHLDPLEPIPRVLYQRVLNEKYGLHLPWRWVGGWALDQVVRTAALTPRPDARLAAAEALSQMGRPVAAAAFVEPALAVPAVGRLGWEVDLARAQLVWARGRLAGRAPLAPVDLEAVRPPAELEGERQALLAWRDLAAGRTREGLERLLQRAPQAGLTQRLCQDALLALTDPRADGRAVLGALAQAIPGPAAGADQSPFVSALLQARAIVAARLGAPFGDDLARACVARPDLQQEMWTDGARAALAMHRLRAALEPRDPQPHLQLLLLWAELDILGCTEAACAEAQQVLVARLERLGRAGAARQLQALDPVDELWVPRVWIPPENDPWRFPGGDR